MKIHLFILLSLSLTFSAIAQLKQSPVINESTGHASDSNRLICKPVYIIDALISHASVASKLQEAYSEQQQNITGLQEAVTDLQVEATSREKEVSDLKGASADLSKALVQSDSAKNDYKASAKHYKTEAAEVGVGASVIIIILLILLL